MGTHLPDLMFSLMATSLLDERFPKSSLPSKVRHRGIAVGCLSIKFGEPNYSRPGSLGIKAHEDVSLVVLQPERC